MDKVRSRVWYRVKKGKGKSMIRGEAWYSRKVWFGSRIYCKRLKDVKE